ncbi:MAG: hypothetical protein DSY89_09980 [Deltaproteobacteria bacterium]|nr:MAG: hypothetical protein DSY89_09980 [Deltaproteobacteria bacterium]
MNKIRGKSRPVLRLLISVSVVVIVASGISVAVYGGYLAKRIEKRFAGRRWNIPSTVYSDTTLLYPGQAVNRPLLYEKLRRLGYNEVSRSPLQKGQMHRQAGFIDIFLHDFTSPFFEQTGFAVRVRFRHDHITTIARIENDQAVPILELEPEELMRFYGPNRERRQLISIDRVPRYLIHAVLAAEDSGFYHHHGVDFAGILRALITNLRKGTISQGGSTLTQQLAKNYFLTPERTYRRKLRELLIALVLEYKYDKNEILEIYLNEIYWGQRGSVSINGVGEASLFYFGKPVERLSIGEAATLAGLIKAPNTYSPYVNKSRCLKRRNEVLAAMRQNDWLTDTQLKAALPRPVEPAGYTADHRRAPYFMDYLTRQMADLYPPNVLSSLGLSIFTTLDTQVQMAAEQALARGLARLEAARPALKRKKPGEKLQGAVIVIQPKTGYILAMVGGRNYGISQFNRATHARRQPGSAFKPLVYVTALDQFTPADHLSNTPRTYTVDGKAWRPKNYDAHAPGEVTLRQALAKSYNLASVNLGIKVGLQSIVDTARAFGLSTTVKPLPSLSLGTFEVIPLELARAYCVFAANGMLPFPLAIKEVMDDSNQMLDQHHASVKRLISPAKAYIMNDLLRSVTTEGTAAAMKSMGVNWPAAGKTGTTNNARDAWFIGYTPDILALVWVGFDGGGSIHSTGSRAALPIWADLMKAIPQYISGEWFTMPSGVVRRTICTDSGQIAVKNACPRIREEIFLETNVPLKPCPIHRKRFPFKHFLNKIKKLFRHD